MPVLHTQAPDVLTLTGLELDDPIDAAIAAYDPDGVLVIKMAGGTVMDGTTVMNVVYDVSLFENDGKRRVWRAKVFPTSRNRVQDRVCLRGDRSYFQ